MIRQLYNTIRYLKPIQVFYQLRYRMFGFHKIKPVRQEKRGNEKLQILIPTLDCDDAYLERFKPEEIVEHQITLLKEQHQFQIGKWQYEQANHLWNFNLHYFEYGVALAMEYRKTGNMSYYQVLREMLQDWIKCNPMSIGDAWNPYTISMRIPNLLLVMPLFLPELKKDQVFYQNLQKSIYQQYRYLLCNQEKHIQGNHYLENIKTIYLCALYFQEKAIEIPYEKKLLKVLKEQILPDGMHFELSMMYHHIVLEDLLRIWTALASLQKSKEKLGQVLNTYIRKMTVCMISLESGMGKLPHFNDAGGGVAKDFESLRDAALLSTLEKKTERYSFPNAGYYKLEKGNLHILFDAGIIGPDYIPGHGHCDALSIELSYDNQPIIVNAGTYQYQGELRPYFRSTRAHNTLVINRHEQSECWGEHRVAKRVRQVQAQVVEEAKEVHGACENYIGEKQERCVKIENDNSVIIKDRVKVKSLYEVKSYLHIHPQYKCRQTGTNELQVIDKSTENVRAMVQFRQIEKMTLQQQNTESYYSEEFGVLEHCTTIEALWKKGTMESQMKITLYGV